MKHLCEYSHEFREQDKMEDLKKSVILFLFAIFGIFFLSETSGKEFHERNLSIRIKNYEEELRIEELPPAENVLLATGYRTGSSFFAELFNQNDEVFYVSTYSSKGRGGISGPLVLGQWLPRVANFDYFF